MSGGRLTAGLVFLGVGALGVVTANAAPVKGATYSGRAADGAGVIFTVSSDGTKVDSYQIRQAHGKNCLMNAGGSQGAWPGAPVKNNSFDYELSTISFKGSFAGKKASGTFRLSQEGQGGAEACDTGTVKWTATDGPAAKGNGTSGSSTGKGTGPGSKHATGSLFRTRVVLKRASGSRLAGKVTSKGAACRAGRTVSLLKGSHRVGRTKTKANGSFSFNRSPRLRGHRLRAKVTARKTQAGTCAAGSSKYVKG